MEARRHWNDMFKALEKKLFREKLYFKNEGEV